MKQVHNKISKLGLKNENWGNSKWKKGGWRMKPRQISTKRSQNRANSTYEEKRGLEMKLGANNYQWGVGVICPRFPTPSFRETGGKYLQLKGQSYLPPVGFMKCFPLPGEEGAGQITLALYRLHCHNNSCSGGGCRSFVCHQTLLTIYAVFIKGTSTQHWEKGSRHFQDTNSEMNYSKYSEKDSGKLANCCVKFGKQFWQFP